MLSLRKKVSGVMYVNFNVNCSLMKKKVSFFDLILTNSVD